LRDLERGSVEGFRMGGKRKNRKKKRHGVIGRKWKRKDCPPVTPGDIDPQGLLTVVRDLGTRGGNRYILATCLCGCKALVEVQLGHFRNGKASCATRSNAQRRRFMEQKEHIQKLKLIGRILDGAKIPDATVKSAVEYATRYIADTELQAASAVNSSASLSARDLRRCNELVSKRSAPDVPAATTFPATSAPLTPPPVPEMGTAAPRKMISEIEVEPLPYQQTEDGFYAEQAYWTEYKQAPPEGFDLKAWYYAYMRKPVATVHDKAADSISR
jgi:hypothetical protein